MLEAFKFIYGWIVKNIQAVYHMWGILAAMTDDARVNTWWCNVSWDQGVFEQRKC